MMQQEQFLTVVAVSERIGVSESTVWRWIARVKNPLPVVRPSVGITRVRESDLNEFMGGQK